MVRKHRNAVFTDDGVLERAAVILKRRIPVSDFPAVEDARRFLVAMAIVIRSEDAKSKGRVG